MLRPRIIPCLLVHKGGLYKTVRFGEPKYVGDPINAVKIFNEKEADEIIVFDIDASAEGREPDFKLISDLAMECRMPLCYGGGMKTAEQAKTIIGLGVEKVSVSSAAISEPDLISTMAREIGRQSVVVTLDIRKAPAGSYQVFVENGKKDTGIAATDLAKQAEELGAGELVVNSIDNDGLMTGYDLSLARLIRASVGIPISILGGAGKLSDMEALFEACGVLGAAAGSLFVFKGVYRAVLVNYPDAAAKEAIIKASLPS